VLGLYLLILVRGEGGRRGGSDKKKLNFPSQVSGHGDSEGKKNQGRVLYRVVSLVWNFANQVGGHGDKKKKPKHIFFWVFSKIRGTG
jgi:hypothetical protein